MSNKLIKDKISLTDKTSPSGGLWARTEVIGGYGEVNINPFGKSTLGEVCFRNHNIVPIGGVSYVMQNIFGVNETQINIPTLYEETGIGYQNSTPATETYASPTGNKSIIYRYGHLVQLYGVGITGTAENDISIYKPD